MREIVVQGARGLGCRRRRFVQQQIDLRQRRQPFIFADLAHVAHQRAAAQHGDRHAGESRGLQAADTVADAGYAPSALGGFQPLDRMVAKDVARRQQRQRDRLFIMRGGLLADHPDQLFLPHHLSAGEIVHPGHQRDIDLAALHTADQRRRQRAVQLQLHPRKGFSKNLEDRRQHERGIEVRRAEHDVALDVGGGELRQHLVVKADNRARIAQHGLAFGGQKQPAPLMDEDRLSRELLQPLQLQGDRRLGAAEPPRRLGDAAGLDHRHQRAQHADIQIDQVHDVARCPDRTFHAIFVLGGDHSYADKRGGSANLTEGRVPKRNAQPTVYNSGNLARFRSSDDRPMGRPV